MKTLAVSLLSLMIATVAHADSEVKMSVTEMLKTRNVSEDCIAKMTEEQAAVIWEMQNSGDAKDQGAKDLQIDNYVTEMCPM